MCFSVATLERNRRFLKWQLNEWRIDAVAEVIATQTKPGCIDDVWNFDVMEINLKEVTSVSFKQMKLIATQLVDQPDFMVAMEHQTNHWALRTGRVTDFTWATDTLSDWDDGTVERMSERWMHHSLRCARVVQTQIGLYRKFRR